MKRFLAALAVLTVLATPAYAVDAVRYLNNNSGDDQNDGETPGTAWRNMSRVQTYLTASGPAGGGTFDNFILMMVAPGQSSPIALPSVAVPAGGFRYYFYGDIANPTSCYMAGGTIASEYLSIRGVFFTSTVTLGNGAARDTIADFNTSNNACVTITGGDYCWVGRGRNNLKEWKAFRGGNTVSIGNTFSEITADRLGIGHGAGADHIMMFGGDTGGFGRADSNTMYRCRLFFNMDPALATSEQFWITFKNKNFSILHSRLEFNNPATLPRSGFYYRDSTSIRFVGDTILAHSGTNVAIRLAGGSFPGAPKKTFIDSCYITNAAGDGISTQDGVTDTFSVTHSVVVAGGHALDIANSIRNKVIIRRNTFVGHPFYGVATFSASESNVPAWVDTVKFMDNIVYSHVAGISNKYSPPHGGCFDPGFPGCYWWALKYAAWKMDSVRFAGGAVSRKHIFNYNLYSYFGDSTANTGDRSIQYWSDFACARPGSGAKAWSFALLKQDSASVYGGPGFNNDGIDTTFAFWLNPDNNTAAIGQSSLARGAASGGADCGAKTYVGTAEGVADPVTLAFEHGTAASKTFTVTNVGDGTMSVTSATSNDPHFTILPQTASIAAAASQVFTVTYTGGSLGPAQFIIYSNSISSCQATALVDASAGGGTGHFPTGDEGPSP